MEPTIPTGSLAVVHEIPASEIAVGDIVTVDRPGQLPITHRVTSVAGRRRHPHDHAARRREPDRRRRAVRGQHGARGLDLGSRMGERRRLVLEPGRARRADARRDGARHLGVLAAGCRARPPPSAPRPWRRDARDHRRQAQPLLAAAVCRGRRDPGCRAGGRGRDRRQQSVPRADLDQRPRSALVDDPPQPRDLAGRGRRHAAGPGPRAPRGRGSRGHGRAGRPHARRAGVRRCAGWPAPAAERRAPGSRRPTSRPWSRRRRRSGLARSARWTRFAPALAADDRDAHRGEPGTGRRARNCACRRGARAAPLSTGPGALASTGSGSGGWFPPAALAFGAIGCRPPDLAASPAVALPRRRRGCLSARTVRQRVIVVAVAAASACAAFAVAAGPAPTEAAWVVDQDAERDGDRGDAAPPTGLSCPDSGLLAVRRALHLDRAARHPRRAATPSSGREPRPGRARIPGPAAA